MKAILLMFDSLNRHMLSAYGCTWTHTPNFRRLAERLAVFDNSYACSLPCMPARRELHTGRYNFLHRGWGPMEPYDDSAFEILKNNGIHTHLISDHYHYWEDGGATYHTRYSSWEGFRGQEGDPWKCLTKQEDYPFPTNRNGRDTWGEQDWVNRAFIREEEDFPQSRTFSAALDFLDRNHDGDNWLLHVEAFDPHEPFYVPQKYLDLYEDAYSQDFFDWPFYREVNEDEETIRHLRCRYAALMSMCDYHLGLFMERMDRYDLWKDTMLILNTDHGFLLGEHGYWGKCVMPFYNEVAHTPLMIWHPSANCAGRHIDTLVQTIDIPATLLEYFGVAKPKDMQGHSLLSQLKAPHRIREAGLFGIHGGQVGCTDGRYVYLHSPVESNEPLYEYMLMPTCHGIGRAFTKLENLRHADLFEGFTFTKGCPVLRVPAKAETSQFTFPSALYDLENDPDQLHPIDDEEQRHRMINLIMKLMQENDCPQEQYDRLGLTGYLET